MRDAGGVLEIGLADADFDASSLRPYQEAAPGRYLVLSVRDTGVGMEREILDRIFDPFFTTRSTGEGSGMGLSVVHGIVRSHGGFITVRSEPGKGSEFLVHLPAAVSDGAEEQRVDAAAPCGTERILFVDDEQVLVDMSREMLGGLGYRVTALTNSQEALDRFLSDPHAFDLVITDITMPGMTGDALTEAILRERPDLPVVICTGFSERVSEDRARQVGARAFLLKPYSMREIAAAIRTALDGGTGDPKP